jgi:hypothetical protein
MMVVAAGTTVALAFLDKAFEGYGYPMLGAVLKIAIPLIAFACGIYFIETNPILRWL